MTNFKVVVLLISFFILGGCGDTTDVSNVPAKGIFSSSGCYIDAVNDIRDPLVVVKAGGTLAVRGWAGDKLSKLAPQSVTVNLVSSAGAITKVGDAQLTIERPDVKKALEAPEMSNPGFTLSAQLEPLAPGDYELHVLEHFPDRILACKTVKSIKIE